VRDSLHLEVYVANLSEIRYWITLCQHEDETHQMEGVSSLLQASYQEDSKTKIVQMGGLEPLIHFIGYSGNTDIKLKATLALMSLSESDVNKPKIVDLGGLLPVVRLLSDTNFEIVRAAADVLWNMTTNGNKEIKPKIIQTEGALASILRILESNYPADLQCKLSGILWNLSTIEENKNKIIAHGALSNLIALLDSPTERVQVNVGGILCNLSYNGK